MSPNAPPIRPGAARTRRRIGAVAVGLGWLAGLVIAAVMGGISLGHWRVEPVLSGSMAPAVPAGAMVLARPVTAEQLVIGDVIMFQSPAPWRTLTMHRIGSIDERRTGLVFRTRGDANTADDPWLLDLGDHRAWRVERHAPSLGWLVVWMQERAVRLGVLLAGVGVLTWAALRRIWAGAADRQPSVAVVSVVSATTAAPRRALTRPVLAVTALVVGMAPVVGAEAGFRQEAAAAPGYSSVTLSAPSGVACRWDGPTNVGVRWVDTTGAAATGYTLERDTGSGYATATTTSGNSSVTATDTPTPATLNTYRVLATKGAWASGASSTATTPTCERALSTIAGTGLDPGDSGDGGPATAAKLSQPSAIATLDDGSFVIADQTDGTPVIRRVDASGTITTVGGGGDQTACSFSGSATGVGGLALGPVWGLAARSGTPDLVYISDRDADCIRLLNLDTGTVTPFAGGGGDASCAYTGAATGLDLSGPQGLGIDGSGNVYVADTDARCVRRISPLAQVSVVAGTGNPAPAPLACTATGVSTTTDLGEVSTVAVDAAGAVVLADTTNGCLRRVGAMAAIAGIAGGGPDGLCTSSGPPTNVVLSSVGGLAFDVTGSTLFVADYAARCVVKLTGSGGSFTAVERVAGDGTVVTAPYATNSGDGGHAPTGRLGGAAGIALTAAGDLLVADFDAAAVRRVIAP